MEDFCFICFYKDFQSNCFAIQLESKSLVYACKLQNADKKGAVGGILDRNKAESLRDFLDVLLEK